MDSSKINASLFIYILFISSATPILSCSQCVKPTKSHKPTKKSKSPIKLPPITLPPITLPPITLPPIVKPPVTNPPTQATCPIDTLKLGACVDLLGQFLHIGIGNPVVNKCCPLLQGLVELEAAVCLCTTLKVKYINLNIYVPLAIQLLITCGKTPPSGYICSL
ncbi:hypothetical protein TanjilG_30828 [Lupinus angustifolius]|uniref:Bifunctional inhibitor/plant lipid transfer protein/seed storage helical domain-containing protein n=1 Tax=Lupinus angustifolius TaxID=3871 RepID=A0A1J7ILM2_LUPAN|nr:PREDICTED: 36.4 kDa proline-rich protein-like [Lupinus angustifolius]XP_019437508.1 PREDICTED: 36.4 kDa proline-rich protein-like [Lupinus angustifolius]OIW15157.1 hypothetical protein TanjilG_30828 [Lupinus angustifolius]